MILNLKITIHLESLKSIFNWVNRYVVPLEKVFDMLLRLLLLGLAIYGAYHLFFKSKTIIIREERKDNKKYTDYEEID